MTIPASVVVTTIDTQPILNNFLQPGEGLQNTSTPWHTELLGKLLALAKQELPQECPEFLSGNDDCACDWCLSEPDPSEVLDGFITPTTEDWLYALEKDITTETYEVSTETMMFIKQKARNLSLGADRPKKYKSDNAETTVANNSDKDSSTENSNTEGETE